MSEGTIVTGFGIKLECIQCSSCGVVFAVPPTLRQTYHSKLNYFWCPNGHRLSCTHKLEDILRDKIAALEEGRVADKDFISLIKGSLSHANRRITSFKGVITKLKNKQKEENED